jgi:hypothetical protein
MNFFEKTYLTEYKRENLQFLAKFYFLHAEEPDCFDSGTEKYIRKSSPLVHILTSRVADPDPYYFWKLDLDPPLSEKMDPDIVVES